MTSILSDKAPLFLTQAGADIRGGASGAYIQYNVYCEPDSVWYFREIGLGVFLPFLREGNCEGQMSIEGTQAPIVSYSPSDLYGEVTSVRNVIANTSQYPYDAVAFMSATFGSQSFRGSAAIIGPHSILTAAHLVWNGSVAANTWSVQPGGGAAISGTSVAHYYKISINSGLISQDQSQYDLAVINFSADLSSYGWFGLQSEYQGGTVHMTGFPANAGTSMTDTIGTVNANSTYSLLDYSDFSANPGNSGGPVWVDKSDGPYITGVVSTASWAALLSSSTFATIKDWMAADSAIYPSWGRFGKDLFGDFNHDGRADILEIGQNGRLNVSISAGSSFATNVSWGSGSRTTDQIGDFNGDGRDDVIQLHENGNSYVWLSNGAAFNAATIWGHGNRSTDKVADFNGDGRDDLIQLHENGNTYIWLSNGIGFGNYSVWGHGNRPSDKIADLNGDGRADIIQLHENGNTYVWLSNGGGFGNYSVWGHGNRPSDRLGDFNGDGKDDVIQLHENGNMYVWLSNGSSFNNYRVWGGGARPNDKIADVNGDGRDDIVELHENGRAYIWLSNGNGFNSYTIWSSSVKPDDQLADVNGDGRLDLVRLNQYGNAYVALSNGSSFGNFSVWGKGPTGAQTTSSEIAANVASNTGADGGDFGALGGAAPTVSVLSQADLLSSHWLLT